MATQEGREVGSNGEYQRLMFGVPASTHGPAIFLDRDGVINERVFGGYVTEWREFRFTRGIETVLLELSALGCR